MTISGMSFINVTPELAFWCQVWLLMAANWAVKSKWAHYHVIVVTISRSDHIVQTVYCSACICEELMNELQIHSSRSAAAAVSEDSHHLIMCKKKRLLFIFLANDWVLFGKWNITTFIKLSANSLSECNFRCKVNCLC